MKTLLIFVGLILLAFGLCFYFLSKKNKNHLPANFPAKGKISPKTKKRLTCIGDSHTHGLVGHDWVADVQTQNPDIEVINAGRNSDLTFSVLARINDIVATDPDFVTLLIGTNDTNATLSEATRKHYVEINRIDAETYPSMENYKENYSKIIAVLLQKTNAKIAVITLPLMSEDTAYVANQKADLYSDFITQQVNTERVLVVDFRTKQKEYLLQHPSKPKFDYSKVYTMLPKAVLCNQVLGWSWNRISEANGLSLLTDNLHLNNTAGDMLVEDVNEFLKGN